MKSPGISAKPSGHCLEVTRLPMARPLSMPPVPSSSSWPMELLTYTLMPSAGTRSSTIDQSIPRSASRSEAANTVICRPRGWLRDGYSVPGSNPVGSNPAALTSNSRVPGTSNSLPASRDMAVRLPEPGRGDQAWGRPSVIWVGGISASTAVSAAILRAQGTAAGSK